jgi:hypothetical protein
MKTHKKRFNNKKTKSKVKNKQQKCYTKKNKKIVGGIGNFYKMLIGALMIASGQCGHNGKAPNGWLNAVAPNLRSPATSWGLNTSNDYGFSKIGDNTYHSAVCRTDSAAAMFVAKGDYENAVRYTEISSDIIALRNHLLGDKQLIETHTGNTMIQSVLSGETIYSTTLSYSGTLEKTVENKGKIVESLLNNMKSIILQNLDIDGTIYGQIDLPGHALHYTVKNGVMYVYNIDARVYSEQGYLPEDGSGFMYLLLNSDLKTLENFQKDIAKFGQEGKVAVSSFEDYMKQYPDFERDSKMTFDGAEPFEMADAVRVRSQSGKIEKQWEAAIKIRKDAAKRDSKKLKSLPQQDKIQLGFTDDVTDRTADALDKIARGLDVLNVEDGGEFKLNDATASIVVFKPNPKAALTPLNRLDRPTNTLDLTDALHHVEEKEVEAKEHVVDSHNRKIHPQSSLIGLFTVNNFQENPTLYLELFPKRTENKSGHTDKGNYPGFPLDFFTSPADSKRADFDKIQQKKTEIESEIKSLKLKTDVDSVAKKKLLDKKLTDLDVIKRKLDKQYNKIEENAQASLGRQNVIISEDLNKAIIDENSKLTQNLKIFQDYKMSQQNKPQTPEVLDRYKKLIKSIEENKGELVGKIKLVQLPNNSPIKIDDIPPTPTIPPPSTPQEISEILYTNVDLLRFKQISSKSYQKLTESDLNKFKQSFKNNKDSIIFVLKDILSGTSENQKKQLASYGTPFLQYLLESLGGKIEGINGERTSVITAIKKIMGK